MSRVRGVVVRKARFVSSSDGFSHRTVVAASAMADRRFEVPVAIDDEAREGSDRAATWGWRHRDDGNSESKGRLVSCL